MSWWWRAYENFLEESTYDYMCENKLIQWNKKLNIVVNPDNKNNRARIIFTKNELLLYCLGCSKKDICLQETKDTLLNILGDVWTINKQ